MRVFPSISIVNPIAPIAVLQPYREMTNFGNQHDRFGVSSLRPNLAQVLQKARRKDSAIVMDHSATEDHYRTATAPSQVPKRSDI